MLRARKCEGERALATSACTEPLTSAPVRTHDFPDQALREQSRVGQVQLQLGRHVFDVATQALVMADWPGRESGTAPDAFYVADHGDHTVQAVRDAAAVGVPVVVQASTSELARVGVRAGASAIDGGVLADPNMLMVIAETDTSVLIQVAESGDEAVSMTIERARWAEAAGLAKHQILVTAEHAHVGDLAPYGYSVVVATTDDDASKQGVHVSAAMAGARVIRSNDVRATTRTVSTVSELLQRRGTQAPEAVVYAGSR